MKITRAQLVNGKWLCTVGVQRPKDREAWEEELVVESMCFDDGVLWVTRAPEACWVGYPIHQVRTMDAPSGQGGVSRFCP